MIPASGSQGECDFVVFCRKYIEIKKPTPTTLKGLKVVDMRKVVKAPGSGGAAVPVVTPAQDATEGQAVAAV